MSRRRQGLRAQMATWNYLSRQIRREAEAARAAKLGVSRETACAECGSTNQSVRRDAELMEDVQGFPLPDPPICCETSDQPRETAMERVRRYCAPFLNYARQPNWEGRHLLLVRGTSWINLWNWRVRVLRGPVKDWHLLTTSEPIAEYPSSTNALDASRLALEQFPGARIYMRADDPDAPPLRSENLTITRVRSLDAQQEELCGN